MNEPSDEMINARIAQFMGYMFPGYGHFKEAMRADYYFCKDEFRRDPKMYSKADLDSTGLDRCIKYGYGVRVGELKYTSSIDSLVPVVEKLGVNIGLGFSTITRSWFCYYTVNNTKFPIDGKSPARALALAVYRILEEME